MLCQSSQEDLFKIALNLEHPWYITLIDFGAERKLCSPESLDFIYPSKGYGGEE